MVPLLALAKKAAPMLLQAAPGIIGGIANIFGARRRRQEENKASQGISSLVDMFREQLRGDYMDTAEAQDAMRAIRSQQSSNNRAINAQAATQGMTDEARLAMIGRNNSATATGMAGLARSADLWRQRVTGNYQNSLGQLFQVGQANRQNFNRGLQNILSPLQSAIDGAFDLGGFNTGTGGQKQG